MVVSEDPKPVIGQDATQRACSFTSLLDALSARRPNLDPFRHEGCSYCSRSDGEVSRNSSQWHT